MKVLSQIYHCMPLVITSYLFPVILLGLSLIFIPERLFAECNPMIKTRCQFAVDSSIQMVSFLVLEQRIP
ncbi:unnamed protein product [Onchocerca flexuosa]|uniref:Uncharacterized protein n=1 Tax=Onchocerca flexuosa TaxID=387005 RepID=A0A183HWK1_9BILA|nr:unnamed protein product [Onchocerca flexuosa]